MKHTISTLVVYSTEEARKVKSITECKGYVKIGSYLRSLFGLEEKKYGRPKKFKVRAIRQHKSTIDKRVK